MTDFYCNVSLAKDNIFVIGYKDGQRYRDVVPYKPSLFLPSKNNQKTDFRALKAGSEVQYVERIRQPSISDARDFLRQYDGIENFSVYGMDRFVYPFIYETFPGQIEYDTDLIKVWNIDIETANEHGGFPNIETANEAITLVGVGIGKKRVIFGYGDYVSKEKRVQFVRCKDEKDMLGKFLNLWSNDDYRPDIVTGWNIEKFDIPYLVNRIKRLIGSAEAKRLSPWGILKSRTIPIWGREIETYEPVGVSVLDYYDLYRKFTYTQLESYTLDHVAMVETGRGKLDYCLSPDTLILTSMLEHKMAKDIKVGDKVIGFDEFPTNGTRKLRNTIVRSVNRLTQPCYRIKTTNGEVICSSLHKWLVSRNSSSNRVYNWITTSELQIGDKIPRASDLWNSVDLSYEDGWMAGILDGEGSISRGGSMLLSVAQNKGIVLDRIKLWFEKNGVEYQESSDGKLSKIYVSGRHQIWSILGRIRPMRLLEKHQHLFDGIQCPGRGTRSDNITEIEYIGEQEVIGITTDHKTLVTNGLLSHNSEFASLHDLYKNNYQKFVDYNITDIDRVADIDDKNRFIELVLAMAYDAKVNFNDALTSVLLWDVIIHNYLMDQGVVIPQNKMKEPVAIPGGFVKDPKIGMHDWVVSFDLTSLYPHLIIQNNISPEMLVSYDENWNEEKFNRCLDPNWRHTRPTALAANGAEFRRETQGVLPALMRRQFNLRVKYKNEMKQNIKDMKEIEKELIERGISLNSV